MIGQVMIMLLRGAMLIALVGTLPAAAAASNTEVGMMWFKKQIAWVIAWAAYPLAAAVIYSAAFLLPGQGGLDALLSGVLLLIAAVVALPVLIRFLVPMTSAVSGGSGIGQIAAEGAAAAMLLRGLPTGAAEVNEDDSGTRTDGDGEGSLGDAVWRGGGRRRGRAGRRQPGRQRVRGRRRAARARAGLAQVLALVRAWKLVLVPVVERRAERALRCRWGWTRLGVSARVLLRAWTTEVLAAGADRPVARAARTGRVPRRALTAPPRPVVLSVTRPQPGRRPAPGTATLRRTGRRPGARGGRPGGRRRLRRRRAGRER